MSKDSSTENQNLEDSSDDLDLPNESTDLPTATTFEEAAAKVRKFPQSPGVYLMKDAAGIVIYLSLIHI